MTGTIALGAAAWLALAAAAAAQGAPNGEDIFATRCGMCHVAEGGGPGPSLTGVVGRKAASRPDFPYTPALKGANLTWTSAALDHFLTDPEKAVPGTAMVVPVPDDKERAALIAYLASLH